MGKLLRFEFRKLFQNKVFYICIAISIALFAITTATNVVLQQTLKQVAEDTGTYLPDASFTAVDLLKGFFGSSNASIITAILVVILVSGDYTNDITKNIYSKGYSRESLFIAKYIVSLIAVLILILAGMLISFFTGAVILDGIGDMGKNYALSIVCIIIIAIAYHSFYFGISLLLKKTGGSIAICIIGPTLIYLLLLMADTFLKIDNFSFANYWLDARISQLSATDVENETIIGSLITSAVIIIPMALVPFFINRKRDN